LEELQIRIVTAIELCNEEELEQEIQNLFEVLKKINSKDAYVRSICFNLIARISVMLFELNENFENIFGSENTIWGNLLKMNTIFDIRRWMLDICRTVTGYLKDRRNRHNSKIIKRMLDYIDAHYKENITISDIANYIYLSPNYISIVFKKEMGKSYY
jgi:two-component system response regulator YesN